MIVHAPESLDEAILQVQKTLRRFRTTGIGELRAVWQPNLFGGKDDAVVYFQAKRKGMVDGICREASG